MQMRGTDADNYALQLGEDPDAPTAGTVHAALFGGTPPSRCLPLGAGGWVGLSEDPRVTRREPAARDRAGRVKLPSSPARSEFYARWLGGVVAPPPAARDRCRLARRRTAASHAPNGRNGLAGRDRHGGDLVPESAFIG